MDAPAKSFALCIKGHGGYFSCTRCVTEGQYIDKQVCFPNGCTRLRTDQDFTNHRDEEYHTGKSVLESIPNLGLVTKIPFDYQHLICLGVTKKLIFLWLTGDLRVRLSFKKHELISFDLLHCIKPYMPAEFQRRPRPLKDFRLWKATEFR